MLEIFLFFIASFLAFFVPGSLALYPLKRPIFENLVLGTILGIALWSIQGYIFGYLGIRWMSYGYLASALTAWVYLHKNLINFKSKIHTPKKIDSLSILIVILGTILNLSAVWFIGVKQNDGLFFCCRGVPDAIYHLSLTHQIIKDFPPTEPGMHEVLVKNYHFLSNLVVADLSRIFNLDFIKVQFQYMSVLLALLLGTSAFVISNILKLGKSFGRWLAIFLYGSGDVLYLLLFFRGKGLDFSVTILDDATKLLAGPPRAFSIVILLGGIALFLIWIKRKDFLSGFLMVLVMGVLLGFKIYSGLFALLGLSALGVYLLLRKNVRMILPLIVVIIISFSYHIQINKGAGGIYFNGLWRFENFVQHEDLAISKLDYLRLEALQKNKIHQVFVFETVIIILYFTFLFGTVNFGFLQSKNSLKLFPKELNIFLISAILGSLFIGSFFSQQTGGTNTIQFIITAFIVATFYAALSINYWVGKLPKRLAVIVGAIVLVLTLPRAFHETGQNIVMILRSDGMKISNSQLESIDFLRGQTNTDFLFVVEPWMAEDEPFMFITFLSNRPVYLSGAGVLRDHGHDTSSREKIINQIYQNPNPSVVKKLLNKNEIKYIYIPPGSKMESASTADFLKTVFDNGEFKIYEVI